MASTADESRPPEKLTKQGGSASAATIADRSAQSRIESLQRPGVALHGAQVMHDIAATYDQYAIVAQFRQLLAERERGAQGLDILDRDAAVGIFVQLVAQRADRDAQNIRGMGAVAGADLAVQRPLADVENLRSFSTIAPRFPQRGLDGQPLDHLALEIGLGQALAGGGPVFLELMTYRFRAHSMYDPERYRGKEEVEAWKERDPIKIYRERLKQFGVAEETILGIDASVKREVDEATDTCKAAPPPALDILTTDVYADGGFAWRN